MPTPAILNLDHREKHFIEIGAQRASNLPICEARLSSTSVVVDNCRLRPPAGSFLGARRSRARLALEMSAETASTSSAAPRARPPATDWWLLGPGVSFPAAPNGTRSTTAPAKSVWAAAALALGTPEGAALAAALLDEPDWRHKYDQHLTRLAELQSTAPPDACVRSCRAGLDALHDTFDYLRGDDAVTLRRAMSRPDDAPPLATAVVRGAGPKPEPALVPIPFRDPNPADATSSIADDDAAPTSASTSDVFEGAAAATLARRWADAGAVEPDVPLALDALHANAARWTAADLEDVVFVLLGGTSELCPARPLLARGASVAVVARGSDRLRAIAEYAAASPGGTLYLPLARAPEGEDADDGTANDETRDVLNDDDFDASPPPGSTLSDAVASLAGANLITQTPEIRTWLASLAPGKRLVIGSYAYLDGEAHVRASLAMDAIASDLATRRPGTALAYLSSPGTAFPIPKDAWDASEARLAEDRGTWWHAPIAALTGNFRGFTPNARRPSTRADGSECRVHNGHLILQGPNYALAKTLQNWRGVVARAGGTVVSANMAPGSRTASMRHVKTVAVGLEGQKYFAPLTAFDADTAAALMANLLLYDLGCETSSAKPEWGRPKKKGGQDGGEDGDEKGRHPMDVFGETAAHGGTWRCAWSVDSIGRASYVAGMLWG